MDAAALGLSALSETLCSEPPVLSSWMLSASVPRSGSPLVLLVPLSSKVLWLSDSAASELSALPTALCWGSPMRTQLVLLLAKWRRWPVSRGARRCPELASKGSGMSGKAPRKAAGSAKSLGKEAALLVSLMPPLRCPLLAQLFKNSGWIWACGALTGAFCAA